MELTVGSVKVKISPDTDVLLLLIPEFLSQVRKELKNMDRPITCHRQVHGKLLQVIGKRKKRPGGKL